jgi:hypothetical protein
VTRVFEWHIPENVVDQMNDVLVHEILFLDKFTRASGRATGTYNKIDSGTAQQALKQIMLTPSYPIQRISTARSLSLRNFSSVGCLAAYWHVKVLDKEATRTQSFDSSSRGATARPYRKIGF